MDCDRFDRLTRLLGEGASRRSVLKSLLGFGGAVAAAPATRSVADARTARSRPTIPPPDPPNCPLPNQMCGGVCCGAGLCKENHCCDSATAVWCGSACCENGLCTTTGSCCDDGAQVCGSLCCPSTASCARTGNADVCCDAGEGQFACGLECCADELSCCGRECCSPDAVCLSRLFDAYPEEICCPSSRACDNQCCDGTCYSPVGEELAGPDRHCCPSGSTVCADLSEGAAPGTGLCCENACCHRDDGSPMCVETERCCSAVDCLSLVDPGNCRTGVCEDFACRAESTCEAGSVCCAGGEDHCCPAGQACCGDTCCDTGLECCTRDDNGAINQVCIDPGTQCCSQIDCVERFDFDDDCIECVTATNLCSPRNESSLCNESACATCQSGGCVDTTSLCDAVDNCTPANCIDGSCQASSNCVNGDICCGSGAGAACCTSDECIDEECCDNSGEVVCGEICCQGACCNNVTGPICVPAGETCCNADADCATLERCIRDSSNQLFHEVWTCGSAGFCVLEPTNQQRCDDDNPCTDATCGVGTGCGSSTIPAGTLVTGGICCDDGMFVPGGVCCDGAACPPVDACTAGGTCTNNRCPTASACVRRSPAHCESASCNEQTGSCVYTDICPGGSGSRSTGSECEHGCQCNINLGVGCSRDSGDTVYHCRRGGGGSGGFPTFCPGA